MAEKRKNIKQEPPAPARINEKKIEHQLLWVIGFVVFLVILYFVASALFKYAGGFTYEGMRFNKEKYGDMPVYHTYYFYNDTWRGIVQYNLYLLTDPRKNDIPIGGDKIFFNKTTVSIGLDDSYPENCRDNVAAVVDLTSFLRGNHFIVVTGLVNKTAAREKNLRHIACDVSENAETIEFLAGNQTRVEISGNCHRIFVGPECRIQDAVEKFKVQAIVDSR